MKTHPHVQKTIAALLAIAAVSCGSEPDAAAPTASNPQPAVETPAAVESVASIEQKVSGLWLYTGLTTGDGTDLPLTGIFLFKDGMFLQQAVFNSEPFDQAGSMAHAGPYQPEPATGSVHLVAEQTISVDPTGDKPISFTPDTDHDVTVSREGDDLTLIFGMGTSTVQEFAYVGPGEGELYTLENGALALVDGYFVLVEGTGNQVTTGYGTYAQQDQQLTLDVIRWSESDGSSVTNVQDAQVMATFDGQALVLADGRSFAVVSDQ